MNEMKQHEWYMNGMYAQALGRSYVASWNQNQNHNHRQSLSQASVDLFSYGDTNARVLHVYWYYVYWYLFIDTNPWVVPRLLPNKLSLGGSMLWWGLRRVRTSFMSATVGRIPSG